MAFDPSTLNPVFRAQLTAMQQTAALLERAQLRLASGKKVNSAIDNPQNFFAGSALSARAGDLSRMLDSMGQNIEIIKSASIGVEALTRLIEQAEAVANDAREIVATEGGTAKVTGTVDLSGVNDLTSLPFINDPAGRTFDLLAQDKSGVLLRATVTISQFTSTEELVAQINGLQDVSGAALPVKASLNIQGQLVIESTDRLLFRIESSAGTATLNTMRALGLDHAVNSLGDATILADGAIISKKLLSVATNTPAPRSLNINGVNNLKNEDGVVFTQINPNLDLYRIQINDGPVLSFNFAQPAGSLISIQEFIERINTHPHLSKYIDASYIDSTGQIMFTPNNSETKKLTFSTADIAVDNMITGFGFGLGLSDSLALDGPQAYTETMVFGKSSARLKEMEDEFSNIMAQIDALVGDASYRGTNLLTGDEMTTYFNETRTSLQVTRGRELDSTALNLTDPQFRTVASVEDMLGRIRTALETVRNFGTTLANDLSVIQTRQDNARLTITTLSEGSDKLTVADQNEEGSKLLALQTRQLLQTTALTLASESQQSILRIFR